MLMPIKMTHHSRNLCAHVPPKTENTSSLEFMIFEIIIKTSNCYLGRIVHTTQMTSHFDGKSF